MSVFEVTVVAIISVLCPDLLAHPSSFNPQVCAVRCDMKSLKVCSIKSTKKSFFFSCVRDNKKFTVSEFRSLSSETCDLFRNVSCLWKRASLFSHLWGEEREYRANTGSFPARLLPLFLCTFFSIDFCDLFQVSQTRRCLHDQPLPTWWHLC